MFSTSQEQTQAFILIAASASLIIFSQDLIFHSLGIVFFIVFYLFSLRTLANIETAFRQSWGRNTSARKYQAKGQNNYKYRLSILSLSLLTAMESTKYFPEHFAVAIALFALILTIREWITLSQWAMHCEKRIARY
ncbi:hypothetical protein [Thalassotalea sp. PS06]|uniref:hypothetical protein n=1 Tax=Thalassotalea sp. PS06 TaxID=2594005 RepID=UPI00116328CD|nr:hypothetical protein [Thalassotalea sp. PS06]QDP01051.1 hypothetical protein FNC98_06640 [Thalassotalea sp. PS06]